MWSVFFSVIAGFLGLIVLFLLLVLFAPFYMKARICSFESNHEAAMSLWWIHPFFLSIFFNLKKNDYYIKVAGWKLPKKRESQPLSEQPVQTQEQIKSVEGKTSETKENEHIQEKTERSPETQKANTETVEKKPGKMDNLMERIKKNWIFFFLRHKKWRFKVFSWLIRVLKTAGRLVRFEYFRADLRAGVEDPAALGRIFGYYQAVCSALQLMESGVSFFFEPVFMKNHFEAKGVIKIRSSVGSMLAPLGVAVFTFPYVSTFFLWRRYKKNLKRMRAKRTL